jgi:hypothetical protein
MMGPALGEISQAMFLESQYDMAPATWDRGRRHNADALTDAPLSIRRPFPR